MITKAEFPKKFKGTAEEIKEQVKKSNEFQDYINKNWDSILKQLNDFCKYLEDKKKDGKF